MFLDCGQNKGFTQSIALIGLNVFLQCIDYAKSHYRKFVKCPLAIYVWKTVVGPGNVKCVSC